MADPPTLHIANIRGIPVKFPFRPYECQVNYMESVIESLQEGKNAMLESPTGTGKTLCLLAASLAWREFKVQQLEQAHLAMAEHADLLIEDNLITETLESAGIMKPRPPVIIYASRTHSQLSQVVAELHRTVYAQSLNICVLGSRSQMCIHPVVSQVKGGMGAVNRACTALVQKSSCTFHSNSELYKNHVPHTKDIEDLISWGRRHSACPYYVAKDQQNAADIIFVPYNYIIDPLILKSLSVDLKGSVVILDEAHNLESVASDAASFDLSSIELKACLVAIQQCLDLVGGDMLPPVVSTRSGVKSSSSGDDDKEPAEPGVSLVAGVGGSLLREGGGDDDWTIGIAQIALLKQAITDLMTEMSEFSFPPGSNVKVSESNWLFDLFENVGITADTAQLYLRTVERVGSIISDGIPGLVGVQASVGYGGAPTSPYASSNALSAFSEALRKMFMTGVPIKEASQHFKAVLQREPLSGASGNARGSSSSTTAKGPFDRKWIYKLSFWCFYPGLAMQNLVATGIRSLIVTSGTLSPLDSFAYELSVPFHIRLENPHVISSSQIWVGVLSTSVDGEKLSSLYKNRSTAYKLSLGRMLVNVARITPGGLLVFFPSYSMMEECILVWRENSDTTNLWDQLGKYKQPVIEPRESNKLKSAMQDFYRKVDMYAGGNSETPSTALPPSVGADSSVPTTTSPSTMNGAVFFAVCRGKVSEGLDFSNQYGRTVVVTGLPLASSKDIKVNLKKEYLDQQTRLRAQAKQAATSSNSEAAVSNDISSRFISTDKPLSGAAWYNQSAWRAVNQAIGRVIRHRNDYGAILFADERFVSHSEQYAHLSKWLRPHAHHIRDPGPAFQSLTKFFAVNREKFGSVPLERKSDPFSSPAGNGFGSTAVIPSAHSALPTTTNGTSAWNSAPLSTSTPTTGAVVSSSTAIPAASSTFYNQVASANARRRSLLDSLPSLLAPGSPSSSAYNAKDSASASSSSSTKTSIARSESPSAQDKKKKKNPEAAQLLNLARTNLDAATYQKFQAQLRRFKTEVVNRSEIYEKLALLLKDSPVVLGALLKYLPAGSAAVITMSAMSTPTKEKPAEEMERVAVSDEANLRPNVLPMEAPPVPTEVLQEPTRAATASSLSGSAIQVDLEPVDSTKANPKKRSFERVLAPDEPPATKRTSPAPLVAKSRPKAFEIADDILDSQPASQSSSSLLSPKSSSQTVSSPSSSQQRPSSTQQHLKPVSPMVIELESPSLQILSVPPPLPGTFSELTRSDELPVITRRASSDLAPISPPAVASPGWLAGLTRTGSGGLPKSPSKVPLGSTSSSPPSSSSSTSLYATPKKHMVDLISGHVGNMPRSQPVRRTSPYKTAQAGEIEVASSLLLTDSPLSECSICAKHTSEMRTAPCGHSCCASCWQEWLAQKMECPFCRGRVRAKKLEKTPSKKQTE